MKNDYDDYYKKVWKTLDRIAERQDKFDAEMAELKKKYDADMAERKQKADAEIAEIRKLHKETDRRMGDFVNSFGDFVENLAAPSIPQLMKDYGITVKQWWRNLPGIRNGDAMEVDVLCLGRAKDRKGIIVVGEIKSTVTPGAVNHFLKQLEKFPLFFSFYKKYPRMGVIAGVKVPSNVIKYAERKGLLVLVPSGDTMRVANKKGFKPKLW